METPVRFGPYRFEPRPGRLWRGEREVRLTPKASAVLGALVARAGQPVTRDELLAAVWGDTVVGDDALTTCVQELRKALGDDAKKPRFIETRHRRGYLFVAPVVEERPEAPAAARPVDASIAVLPFVDMSPGRDHDYLCEGLAEELISALTQIRGLRVAARSASFRFRGSGIDVRAAGRRLGVATLLEGSVRKAGDRLRVTVQLVDSSDGFHRWSQRFDRRLDDVFAMQDEIAASVATALGVLLGGHERRALRRAPAAVEAYEHYLRGRQHLHRMTKPDLERSREAFGRAIALDASYGPAWAGLATAHATLYEWFGGQDTDLERAERASRLAAEHAPELAEAQVARGFAASLARRYDEAERAFEEAIRIDPNLFDAHYYYARACFARGRIERSVELFASAASVRHEDYQSPVLLAQPLKMLGRTAEAMEANREGIRRAERVLALNPLDRRALSLGAVALYEAGDEARAMEWSDRALELDPDDMSALVNAACLRARAGRKDEALEVLERVFARGWGKKDWVENDPDYDSLRDDPRFQKLLARLK